MSNYKNILKKINSQAFDFISFLSISSILIALIGILLPYFTFLMYNIKPDFYLLLSSYLLTFTVYSIDKISNINEDSISLPERAEFIIRHRKILTYVTMASYFVALTLAFLRNNLALFIILFPLCIGLVYSIKISNFRLKDIPALKNISIALSWAIVGTFLPLADSSRPFASTILIFSFVFIKCFINSVLFDVRDIEGDSMNGVRTIPVLLGLNNTKYLLLTLNSTLIPWLMTSYSNGYFHKYGTILILIILYGHLYIVYFCKKNLKIGKALDLIVDCEWIYISIFAFFVDMI